MMKKLRISNIFLICTFTFIVTTDMAYGKAFQAAKNMCILKPNSTTVGKLHYGIIWEFDNNLTARATITSSYCLNNADEDVRDVGRLVCKIYADLNSDVEMECPVEQVSLTQYEWYKVRVQL